MEPLLQLGETGAEASRQATAEVPPVSGVNRVVPLYDARTILGQQGIPALPHDASAALLTIARWLDGYVSRPHPALGRTGEICPWTRRTIDLGSLLLTPIASDDQEEIGAVLLALLERFAMTEPRQGLDASFRSIVGVLHRLDPETATGLMIATHARLKPRFLARGLMLGEFYPACDKPGLRSPAFRPLRSPVPLFVIRPMVEADIEFLLDRDEFVEAYLLTHRARGGERLARILEQQPASVAPERRAHLLGRAREYRDARPDRSYRP